MPDVKNLISLWESRSGTAKAGSDKQKAADPLDQPLADPLFKHSMDEKSASAPSAPPDAVTDMSMDEKTAMVKQGFGTEDEIRSAMSARNDHKRAFAPVLDELGMFKPEAELRSEKK